MANRWDRDFEERDRGRFGGDYARDTHRGGWGDDYARDGGWSGGGRGDDYAREERSWGGTGARGDWFGGGRGPRDATSVGYGPGQTRSTYGEYGYGGTARAYGETDVRGFRGRGPKNWRPSDERIRDTVNELLTDHDGVDATEIDVRVENAEVTLEGTVGSRWEKRLAEDIAASCRGVHDVHNRLRIADREAQVGKASE